MQRNFEPMRKQVEAWQRSELTDVIANVVIYEAFVEGKLEAPKHLARTVHDLYFEPKYEEFRSRTIWSLSNAFNVGIQATGIPGSRNPSSFRGGIGRAYLSLRYCSGSSYRHRLNDQDTQWVLVPFARIVGFIAHSVRPSCKNHALPGPLARCTRTESAMRLQNS
jgi:hypothetical protein